ncbi:MAG: hypothetical protein ACAH80_15110 [Alphaproteobacteria bacterium]
MGTRAFISVTTPADLIVTETPSGVEAAAVRRSAVVAIVTRFILFPLLLLPLALYAHGVTHTGEGLLPVDYARLLKEPAAFAAILPSDTTFRIYFALPWIIALLFFTKYVHAVLRRPRISVTAEALTLHASFPRSWAEKIDLSAVPEIHIRAYIDGRGYQPQLSHFIALPAGERVFDFLIGIEKSDAEGFRKLQTLAGAIARLHSKPLKHFNDKGEEEPKP